MEGCHDISNLALKQGKCNRVLAGVHTMASGAKFWIHFPKKSHIITQNHWGNTMKTPARRDEVRLVL